MQIKHLVRSAREPTTSFIEQASTVSIVFNLGGVVVERAITRVSQDDFLGNQSSHLTCIQKYGGELIEEYLMACLFTRVKWM